MATPAPIVAPQPAGLSLGDIYFVLFRHKWKILVCTVLGLSAAAAVWQFSPPPYQSAAKLFVRYVPSDHAIGPGEAPPKSPDQRGETIMSSEQEILTSVDVARRVAETIGAAKILGKQADPNDIGAATVVVRSNLSVTVPPKSSVIYVAFSHSDPDVVQPVLREVVNQYLKLHVETHTASGMVGEVLSQETDQLRSRLSQTEEELRRALNKAGVISLEDAKKMYSDQLAATRKELFDAEADLALRTAALDELKKRLPAAASAPSTAEQLTPIPSEILTEYRSVFTQVELLQRMEQELLTQFTAQNPRVIEVREQLKGAVERRDKIQERYPRLLQIGPTPSASPNDDAVAAATLATQVVSQQAKIAVLKLQLDSLRAEAAKLDQNEGTIVELRRKKELEEANYRFFSASLEQSRINDTLGNGRVSNIIPIQTPSAPYRDHTKTNKIIGSIAAAGLVLGLAWAFASELYLDRSIKRPLDVERSLASPLLLTIPHLDRKRLAAGHNGDGNGSPNGSAIVPHGLDPYHETLRDRIIAYFESIGLNHKPKLVAITALNPHAGVTTTAAGLARTLSETGEGHVLLVDMSVGDGVAQQFSKGKPTPALDQVLERPNGASVQPKLYVVAENSNSELLSRNMPARFTKMVPKMKASDFDYIIFDMPPVTQISITPRLAGFMDLVLLVIESERTDRDVVQRATRLLTDSRAKVGVVLNKTRRYVPERLVQEPVA